MMTRVVITGATGFVGGALARELAHRGAEIVALARYTSDRSGFADLNITWEPADVTDPKSLKGLFANADVVIHAAGKLGEAGVPESYYRELHVGGAQNVLAEIEDTYPRPRVLYVSSPGVLGPISGPPADETRPPAPSNAYERSKAYAEQVVAVYAKSGVPVVIARPEFIYGPGDMHVLGLFRAVQQGVFFYVGDGRNTCHPTYIDDAVNGMLLCLEKGRTGEIYHICGPRAVSFEEFGAAIAAAEGVAPPKRHLPYPLAWSGALGLEIMGKILRMRPPLSRSGVAFFSESRAFSWQKAHTELGYTPQVDLSDGMVRTVAWYRQKKLLE